MPVELQPEHVRLLREAHGFAQLGDYEHAWNLVDELPADCRAHHQALEVLLIAATGMNKWTHGEDIAEAFARSGRLELTEVAGRFYLEKARAMLADGYKEEAAEALKRMSKCWPGGRILAVDDPTFRPLFN